LTTPGRHMITMELLWILGVVTGHTLLLFAVWGRLTAMDLPRVLHDVVEGLMAGAILLFPLWLAWGVVQDRESLAFTAAALAWGGRASYDYLCLLFLAGWVPVRIWERWRYPVRDASDGREVFHVPRERPATKLSHARAAWAARLPGNQILDLEVNHKTIPLAGLKPALDGITVVHLSDFHFTGHLDRAYYEFVVERANDLQGDLVVLTGDFLDDLDCLQWIPDVLGRLEARLGIFAILGNHDKRLQDVRSIVQALESCGIQYLGGRWRTLHCREADLLLAGNESPWLPPAAAAAEPADSDQHFRILLSHSPDQIGWARRFRFDLVLAGHTHGGQVRLPGVGPVLAPSRYGTRYASGLFYEHPTWMHVSRGVAGAHPLRIGCRPEVTRLVLTRRQRAVDPVRGIAEANRADFRVALCES
jgi:uncharacterized protein